MIKRNYIVKVFASLLFMVFAFSCGFKQDKQQTDNNLNEETDKLYAYGICIDSLHLNHYKIESGDNLSGILMNLGFTGNDAEQITETISPLYPPSKLQIGNTYAAISTSDTTSFIQYLIFEK